MENILKILSDLGITVPEDKHAELNRAVAKNYKTVVEFEKQTAKLTAATERAEAAEETLKGFEGKDYDAIIRERNEWQSKHDALVSAHQKEQEEREFNNVLSTAISEAKGKNAKAITALLDLEKLRSSKNQEKDIKAALDAMRTESGYLFEDNGGKPTFTDPKGNGGNGGGGTTTLKDIMKIKDPVERQRMIGQNLNLFGKGE